MWERGPERSGSSTFPFAGSQFHRSHLHGLPPNTLAIYAFGFTPDNRSLTPLGLTGCSRFVGDPILATLWGIAGGSGTAGVTYALPDDPLFVGDLQAQWLWLAPGVNPAGILTYHGAQVQVR